jgi:hypothetical protein
LPGRGKTPPRMRDVDPCHRMEPMTKAVCRCGSPFDGRADRCYCSPRCRTAAHRARERDVRRARLGVIAPAAPTEASLLATIARAAETDWRAAAWLVRYLDSRPTVEEPVGVATGPFAEVDELAEKRRSPS